jgi:hypothetical protein
MGELMNYLMKIKYRFLSMCAMERKLRLEQRTQSLLCCVNLGDGVGRNARDRYRRLAKAYNKARHYYFGELFPPVPQHPPEPANVRRMR